MGLYVYPVLTYVFLPPCVYSPPPAISPAARLSAYNAYKYLYIIRAASRSDDYFTAKDESEGSPSETLWLGSWTSVCCPRPVQRSHEYGSVSLA